MTADAGWPGSVRSRRRRSGPRQMLPVWLRRVGPAERIRMLTIRGCCGSPRGTGDPGRPLLLCNGIGARLEGCIDGYAEVMAAGGNRDCHGHGVVD
jgi:hypothetical protein